MKLTKYLLIALVPVVTLCCKDNVEQDQKENSTESVAQQDLTFPWADESDVSLSEGLNFMQNKQNAEAVKSLRNGMTALKLEAKDVTGNAREKVNNSIKALDSLVSELEMGKNVPISKVRELIADAKINTNYGYLSEDDDVHISEMPPSTETAENHRNLNTIVSSLEKEESNIKADAKSEFKTLMAEGKKLEKEEDSWNQRTKEYNRRINEYFKIHYPQHYMQRLQRDQQN